jgi:hypothetical protein
MGRRYNIMTLNQGANGSDFDCDDRESIRRAVKTVIRLHPGWEICAKRTTDMPFLLLVCLISISTFLCTPQEKAQIPSTNPELIEGPWETTGVSGVDGIFLTTVTGSNWQTINIRVYHRIGRKETWGNFGTDAKATAGSYNLQDDHSLTLFNGSRLRIHFADVTDLKPFDLDVIFSSSSHKWSGRWSSPSQTSKVILRRPESKSGLAPRPFVGDWMSVSSNNYPSGSLHIRQSSDGTHSAWLDRVIDSSDRRNGEFLQLLPSTTSELRLERPGLTGPSYHYRGTLSGDGQMLTGGWAQNGCGRLNAPDKIRKAPD